MRRAARSMAYTRGVAPYIPHCGGPLHPALRWGTCAREARGGGGARWSDRLTRSLCAGSELPSLLGEGRRRSGGEWVTHGQVPLCSVAAYNRPRGVVADMDLKE